MGHVGRRGRPDVTRVLLGDGWHDVDRQTFEIDGHSFGFAELVAVPDEHDRVTATTRDVTGPLTSVLAVESEPKLAGGDADHPLPPPAWP
jgi:hypothetical protein